jgi:hypothetical protein
MNHATVRHFTTRAVTVAIIVVPPLACGSVLAFQADPTGAISPARSLTLGEIFTFFFLMLGR